MTIGPDDVRKAKTVLRQHRRETKAARPKPEKGRVRNSAYLNWLHRDLECVACVIEQYPTWPERYPIEAAHQKNLDGKGATLGRRVDDRFSCSLCAWHHRLGPLRCDPAQRKFWSAIGVSAKDFCAALFEAFENKKPGADVVRRFAGEARR